MMEQNKMEKQSFSSFVIFFLYRLSSVFVIQTSYVPDEYWQSLEVAHNMAFGYGYLTWEWKYGLRSYLYPSCFAFVFKILEIFHIDFGCLIVFIPKLLQAVLTAVSDQYFVLLCTNFQLDDYWAGAYILTNWFWYYCGCRTITNTFETSLTIIALYYYPWDLFIKKTKGKKTSFGTSFNEMKNKSIKYMTLSAINCVVRPTAATIWGPLVLFHLYSVPSRNLKQVLLKWVLPVFGGVIFTSVVVDFLCYKKFIIPSYNFLVFNIFKDVSSFYGTHPYHWYITQGLLVILGPHIFPFGMGLLSIFKEIFSEKDVIFKKVYIIWIFILTLNMTILCFIPHKEFRFALPLIPLMTLIAVKQTSDYFKWSETYKLIWTFLIAFCFVIATILFGIFHQRGSLEVMKYLSNASVNCSSNCSFLFLMPCHSTPLYSHLHVNVTTRFLTCDPPITDNFYDESDYFFKNPIRWLEKYWDDKKPPSHVALFDYLEYSVSSFLNSKGFIRKQEFMQTVFARKNAGKFLIVYEPT